MNGTIVIPGPEVAILFGVHVPVLSAIFGIGGVLLGHLIAPPPQQSLGWRRNAAIVAAGMLTSISITIATGQRPLIVLGWSIGIGFSGLALFAAIGAQVVAGAHSLGDILLNRIATHVADRKDGQ